MPLTDPKMKFVFPKIGNVRQEFFCVAVHRLPGNNPAHVRPQTAVTRRVWITFLVGILMVHPVSGHPGDGSAFEGQRAADCQEMLDALGCLVAPVSEQTVVTDADAQTSSDPPKYDCQHKRLPAEHEQRGDGADVKSKHEQGCRPVKRLLKSLVVREYSHDSNVTLAGKYFGNSSVIQAPVLSGSSARRCSEEHPEC